MNTSQSDSLIFLPDGYVDSPSSLVPDGRSAAEGFPFGWDGQSPASTNSITSSVSLSSLDDFRFGSQSSSSSSLMEHRSQVSSSSDGDSEGTSSSSFCSGNGPAFSFTPPAHPALNRSYSSTSSTSPSIKLGSPLSRSLSSRPPSKPLLHLPIPSQNGPAARRGSLPASGAVPFQNNASGPGALAARRGSNNGPPPAPSAWSWNARGSELQGMPSPLRMEYTSNDLGLVDDGTDDDVTMDDLAEIGGRRTQGSPRKINGSPSPVGGTRSFGSGYNGGVVRGKPGSPYGRGGHASRKMSLPTHFASHTTTSYSSTSSSTTTTTTTTTTSAANNFFLSQPGMMSSSSGTPRAVYAVPSAGTQTPLSPESPTTHLQPIPPHRSQQQLHQQQHHQIKQPSFPASSLLHQTKPGAAGYPFPTQQKPHTPPATPRTALSGLPSQSSSSSASKGNKGSNSTAASTATPPPAPSGPSTLSVSLLDGHDLNPLFESRYTLISSLGSGGYGFVCVATDHSSGKEVAVKFILASKVPSHAWVAYAGGGEEGDGMPEVGGKVPMECEVLRRVRHWGVVAGLGVYYDGKFFYLVQELHGDPWAPSTPGTPSASSTSSPALPLAPLPTSGLAPPSPFAPSFALPASPFVGPTTTNLPSPSSPLTPLRPSINMERRGSCDLFECVERHKKFGEARARMIFKQIVETVSYLARVGIYHRDIKDENLVIDRDYKVKLIDFGSAVWERDPAQPGRYKEFFGTTAYASPEIITGRTYLASEAEVWSLGILLCILVTGESPFASPKEAQIGKRSALRNGVRMSKELNDLIDRCLEVSPERRINIEEMRGHRWLASH